MSDQVKFECPVCDEVAAIDEAEYRSMSQFHCPHCDSVMDTPADEPA